MEAIGPEVWVVGRFLWSGKLAGWQAGRLTKISFRKI